MLFQPTNKNRYDDDDDDDDYDDDDDGIAINNNMLSVNLCIYII